MAATLIQLIRKADNLPTLPSVALDILELTRSEDASADDFAQIIQRDPTLTAKLLKVVNSPLFGIPREIGSVKQAVSLLGLRTVKVMALSFSLVDTVQRSEGTGFNFEAYWRRSLSSAVTARLLGKAVAPRLAEESFVAGLLCDIGAIGAWWCAPEQYAPILDVWSASARSLSDVEHELLGLTHAQLGRELLQSWGLPERICESVGAHHGDGLDALEGPTYELAKIVHSAASVADLFCQETPAKQLSQVKAHCLAITGITAEQLEQVLSALDTNVHRTAATLSVPVGETMDYTQIQMMASAQLAQLTMQAEVERVESSKKEQEARMEAQRLHEEKKAILEVASMDALTNVANRAAFDKRLVEEIAHAEEAGHLLGLLMLDVDHFKRFNDTHGHQAGDAVLRRVGECLHDVVRNAGFVARYGGEEFAIILADQALSDVRSLAEQVRMAICSSLVRHEDNELAVTASVGAACVDPTTLKITPEALIQAADRLLYDAKRNGRNRVECG